jgi:hypothetical protein
MDIVILSSVVLLVVLIIVFTQLPFFSSTKSGDIELVIQAFDLQNDQVLFDLGAGQGNLIFAAANEAHKRGLNTVFYALEINYLAILLVSIRAFFHPHRNYIRVRHENILKSNYEKRIEPFKKVTFYLYIAPWLIHELTRYFKNLSHPATIISYKYKIEGLELSEKIQGKNAFYVYKVHPASPAEAA